MNDPNLTKGHDVHFDVTPEGHAMTMGAESVTVFKPSIIFNSDSELKEEELYSEVVVPSIESRQYFSTPVQRECKKWASTTIDLQEETFGYKTFFSLECGEIIHQLQSKAAQGWSADKRKLEELEISTIEAEPLPLLCWTPKSVVDETTCSAKRRRIDDRGDPENITLHSFLSKHNSPGSATSRVQGTEEVQRLYNCRNGDLNSTPGKSSHSESHRKRSLFLKASRIAHPYRKLPAMREKSEPKELKRGACSPLLNYNIQNKMTIQNHESPLPALVFRSFFAAECEKICKQLKNHDTERIMFGNMSSIEAEPPPVLSATMNSTVILEPGSTCKENSAIGISQLDLEKMNIHYHTTERAFLLQKAQDSMLHNSNATGSKVRVVVTDPDQDCAKIYGVASLANITKDLYNEELADCSIQEIKIVHNNLPIAVIMPDIGTMHDQVIKADPTQGMGTMLEKGTAFIPTPDITVCDDGSIVNGTPVILTVGHNLKTYPTGIGNSDVFEVNDRQNIGAICNEVCSKNSITEATQDVSSMFNEKSVAGGTQNITEHVSEVDVTVDIETIWGAKIDPEVKDANIVQTCSKIPVQKNFQNIVSIHSQMTPDSAIYKTFTHCKVTEPNVTHDIISVYPGAVAKSAQDLTQVISYPATPNVSPDLRIINDVKPNANATQTLMSIANEVPAIDSLQDSGDLTKVMAANCLLLENQSKNVCNPPEKRSRQMWPITALVHSSSRSGSMCNMKDSTYNLDLTDVAHYESVFYNHAIPFITSTPLPSLGNPMSVKICGLPVKSKSSIFGGEQDGLNKNKFTQRAVRPQLTLGGKPRTRGGISHGVQHPRISRSNVTKVIESSLPQPESGNPAPCSTLARSVLKTQMPKEVVSRKHQVALGRTNMKPPLVPTRLPKKNMQYLQLRKSGTSSSIVQQQTPVNCIKTGADVFKKRIDASNFPAPTLVRPSFWQSTPSCQMYAGKVQSISGPQSAAGVCKISSVHPASVTGFEAPGIVQQEPTFIRSTNPVGSQISSKMKPRASGLPVLKSKEAVFKV